MSDLSRYSEKDLLIKVAEGNENAFQVLFSKYHQALGTHIFRITDSADITEEIVQDIFLKIWISREVLTGVENFKAYLFVISKNHTLNYLRKLSKERLYKKIWEDNAIRSLSLENNSTDTYYSLLDAAIDQLPPQQQKVYLLSRHERLKYAEVASRLNLSRETVKKYLQNATASITTYVQNNVERTLFLPVFFLLF